MLCTTMCCRGSTQEAWGSACWEHPLIPSNQGTLMMIAPVVMMIVTTIRFFLITQV
jgi:hypothetical protein